MSLNPKQKRFCKEYLVDHNATQAAIRTGYSKKTAKQMGTENLSKPAIRAEIARLSKPIEEKIEISAEIVLRELAAYATKKKHLDRTLKPTDNLTALNLLGKHFKMFTDLVESTHTFNQLPAVRIDGVEIELNVGKPHPDR